MAYHDRMKTLIVKPGTRPGTFQASLDGTQIGKPTRQPMADGARTMLQHGHARPGDLVNMRHDGAKHPSFKPATAGSWAAITYGETAEGLRPFRYKPLPPSGKAKKRPPG